MSHFKCNCAGLALIGSLIIGVIVAILRITAVITATPVFLWVALGVAIIFLLAALAVSAFSQREKNSLSYRTLSRLLTGVLGTILTAIILLGIPFVATSILGALITGALGFFFAYTLSTAACYAKCLNGYE